MSADPNKTVTATLDADGNIVVVTTHNEDYTPSFRVESLVDVEKRQNTTPLSAQKVGSVDIRLS